MWVFHFRQDRSIEIGSKGKIAKKLIKNLNKSQKISRQNRKNANFELNSVQILLNKKLRLGQISKM